MPAVLEHRVTETRTTVGEKMIRNGTEHRATPERSNLTRRLLTLRVALALGFTGTQA